MNTQATQTPSLYLSDIEPVSKDEVPAKYFPLDFLLEERQRKPIVKRPLFVKGGLSGLPISDSVDQKNVPLDAFVLENVLSQEECDYLVQLTEKVGFTFWNTTEDENQSSNQVSQDEETSPESTKKTSNQKRKDFRDADTIEVTHPELAELLWSRMKPFIEMTIVISPDDEDRYERDLEGTWEAQGTNPNKLFVRYVKGGHFAPHTDGRTAVTFNYGTMFSLLLYLNNCEEGGATHLMLPEQTRNLSVDPEGRIVGERKYIMESVKPSPGLALLFYHTVTHEGEPVHKGRKYLIRSDIMYQRVPPICDSPTDQEAFGMYEKAKLLGGHGFHHEASLLFKKAFKLSPALANVYGQ